MDSSLLSWGAWKTVGQLSISQARMLKAAASCRRGCQALVRRALESLSWTQPRSRGQAVGQKCTLHILKQKTFAVLVPIDPPWEFLCQLLLRAKPNFRPIWAPGKLGKSSRKDVRGGAASRFQQIAYLQVSSAALTKHSGCFGQPKNSREKMKITESRCVNINYNNGAAGNSLEKARRGGLGRRGLGWRVWSVLPAVPGALNLQRGRGCRGARAPRAPPGLGSLPPAALGLMHAFFTSYLDCVGPAWASRQDRTKGRKGMNHLYLHPTSPW